MAIKGHKVSKETRRKLRLFNLGRRHSIFSRLKISKSLIGNKRALGHRHNSETRRRMSNSHTGKKLPASSLRSLLGNKYMLGKKHSNHTKRNMSLNRMGKLNKNWKGGITPINRSIRASRKYALWREKVFKRDNWTCVLCKAKSQKGIKVIIHADHIKAFSKYPEYRFMLSNGRTLCEPCHKCTDNYCGKLNKKQHGQ